METKDKVLEGMTKLGMDALGTGFEAGRKEGRKEVVEWIKKQRTTPLGKDYYGYYIWEAQLEAKLKEWGIEKT